MFERAKQKDTLSGIFLLKKYNPEFRDRMNVDIQLVDSEIHERMTALNLKQLPPMTTQFADTQMEQFPVQVASNEKESIDRDNQ